MRPSNITILSRRCIATVKPHTPLIRFRKGGNDGLKTSSSSGQTSSASISGSRPVLEDYQLPLKYRRRPLDDSEINAINSGGVY